MKTVVQKILPHIGSCVSKADLLAGLRKINALVNEVHANKGAKKQKLE